MPTYEYRCPSGHEFEHFYRTISSAEGSLPCPTCGAVAQRKISAGSGLHFKGSGFYITDYGKDGKKDQRQASARPEGGSSSGGEGGGSSGGDGGAKKPADKPASGSGGGE